MWWTLLLLVSGCQDPAARACADGDGAACASVHQHERACELGHAPSCLALGRADAACALGDGASCSAVGRHEEACERGQAASCAEVGRHEEACALGVGRSCWALGVDVRWRERAAEQALRWWEQACATGEPLGCTAAGLELKQAQPERALPLFDRACALDGSGCGQRDEVEGSLADGEACADGEVDACERLCGKGLARGCAPIEADLQRRCGGGEAGACTLLGTALMEGWLDPGDPARGRALLWRGCRGNDPWGCLRLAGAVAAGADNPSPKSLAWLDTQVCDLQLWYGCAPHPAP